MGYKIVKQLLENEYWWGGIVNNGGVMPMGDIDLRRDLTVDVMYNQCAPFLISNKGRYAYCEGPFSYEFKNRVLTLESDDEIIFSEGHETLKNAYLDAVSKYIKPSGKMPDELLFLNPQFNNWIEMIYWPTGEKVEKYADKIIEMGIKPGVIMIDDNWQEDYGVWTFHEGRFPNPKKTIDYLHSLGFKVMLWVCNYISPDCLTFREAEEKGYLIKDKKGDSLIVHWWNGYSGIIDLTNPEAVKWLKSVFDKLVDELGIDGFKFDAGDPVPELNDCVMHKQITPLEYCEQWAKFGLNYSLSEYRACWKMQNQPLMQRLCDKHHGWGKDTGVASLVPNGLLQGIMGYGFNCPDMIGGGEYKCFMGDVTYDSELVVRYAQVAALFPMMQFSVSPWSILNEEELKACIDAANLHSEFGKKIVELAKNCAKTGEPITRYMEYEFPNCGYEKIDDQFMLGSDIMVAPVVTAKTYSRDVVFPKGKWEADGEVTEGPCVKTMDAPLNKLLWFRKVDA